MRQDKKQGLYGLLLCLPAIAFFIALYSYPLATTFYLSFYDWSFGVDTATFIGIENYAYVLTDPSFHQSLWVTMEFLAIKGPLNWMTSLGLALLINRKFRFVGMYRIIFFLPIVIPLTVSAVVWSFMYNSSFGLLNHFTRGIGLGTIPWTTSSATAIFAIIIMGLWRDTGLFMIIFLAALQTIPRSLIEAAKMDAARRWDLFRHITLPLLKFAFVWVVIITMIRAFGTFSEPWFLTRGGPAGGTRMLSVLLYQSAFEYMDWGYTTTVAVLMFVLLFVISIGFMRLATRDAI